MPGAESRGRHAGGGMPAAEGNLTGGVDAARIAWLVRVSQRVFGDCLLPNGCTVAAPSQMPYFPKSAKSYLHVWPGQDSGFIIARMQALGRDVREPLLAWLPERAESLREAKLIYGEYHPSGSRRGPEWQPHQAGTLLGPAWPFDVVPDNAALAGTREAIERELYDELGVHRYRFDGYDGEVEEAGAEIRQGAGAWPLLTVRLAIDLLRRGRQVAALHAFENALSMADRRGHFPEMRLAPGDPRSGVRPLLWTHMMFVLAAQELGLLPAVA